jgi:hypothetical protein
MLAPQDAKHFPDDRRFPFARQVAEEKHSFAGPILRQPAENQLPLRAKVVIDMWPFAIPIIHAVTAHETKLISFRHRVDMSALAIDPPIAALIAAQCRCTAVESGCKFQKSRALLGRRKGVSHRHPPPGPAASRASRQG